MKILGFDLKNKIDKLKFIILMMGLVVFLVLGTGAGLMATSDPKFCASCHNMSPQVYTWKASSHKNVACTDCHTAPGVDNMVRDKANIVKQFYYKFTDTYLAPIKMPSVIPDVSCQKCHNMNNRTVTASGDIIIDHQVHDKQGVACVTCHDGIAHGKVSEKRVTYKSDYAKWNEMLAQRFMEDIKSVRPHMDTCMECHELKKAPLACSACHTTSMLPEEHKTKDFIAKEHMQQARGDILYCNTCHSYTTKTQIAGLKGKSAYANYLSGKKSSGTTVRVEDYAKNNDYCVKCHSQRPASHNNGQFIVNHGVGANKNSQACMTCHEYRATIDAPVTRVDCASCHPSIHQGPWRTRHPVPFKENQKIEQSCLQCHVETTCVKCHANLRRK